MALHSVADTFVKTHGTWKGQLHHHDLTLAIDSNSDSAVSLAVLEKVDHGLVITCFIQYLNLMKLLLNITVQSGVLVCFSFKMQRVIDIMDSVGACTGTAFVFWCLHFFCVD